MSRVDLKKKMAPMAGLGGGIITLASLFMTWMSIIFIKANASMSKSASGLDLILGNVIPALKGPERYILGIGVGLEESAMVILIGGTLALIGGIVTLVTQRKIPILLMPCGGIIVLVSGLWGLAVLVPSSIEFLNYLAKQIPGEKVIANAGYGIYASIVGGVFASIGSLSLIARN